MKFVKLAACGTIAGTIVEGAVVEYEQNARRDSTCPLVGRDGSCPFPNEPGIVRIEHSASGWAISDGRECTFGSWCSYACPPGQLMAQWDPSSGTTPPGSMHGGLYCSETGELKKPIPDNGYCIDGKGTTVAINHAPAACAICQTVFPGNEEMLIPNVVETGQSLTLAVPGPDYWSHTGAHYFVNPPGIASIDACRWGSDQNPYGNYAPYVVGTNMDQYQNTFVSLSWNPNYLNGALGHNKPTFGVRLTCESNDCVNSPCAIDPRKHNNNEMDGQSSIGSGGARFCVLTATHNSKAKLEIFSLS